MLHLRWRCTYVSRRGGGGFVWRSKTGCLPTCYVWARSIWWFDVLSCIWHGMGWNGVGSRGRYPILHLLLEMFMCSLVGGEGVAGLQAPSVSYFSLTKSPIKGLVIVWLIARSFHHSGFTGELIARSLLSGALLRALVTVGVFFKHLLSSSSAHKARNS